jgi:3',5'-cyclic AMP phosphodiesterase CpdA
MPKAEFMLHAGDLINQDDNDQEWGEWFYAGGWINQTMPTVATPGNHEYDREGELSPMWRTHFTFPENGPQDGDLDLSETAYYFDYQGVRFISIDSHAMSSSTAEDVANAQAEWLIETLEGNPNRWTIVFHHHPVFTASENRRDHAWLSSTFKPIYEDYGVDLVLQGHDHSYARGDNLGTGLSSYRSEDGPVYVVSVAGPKMYTSDADWADVTGGNTQLYQLIDVSNKEIRYRAFSADGQAYDSFNIRKHNHHRHSDLVDSYARHYWSRGAHSH